MSGSVGQPHLVAVLFFFGFIAVTLGITWWAARHTLST
jgi:cation/acetate symporter